jgi:hypothetical protein
MSTGHRKERAGPLRIPAERKKATRRKERERRAAILRWIKRHGLAALIASQKCEREDCPRKGQKLRWQNSWMAEAIGQPGRTFPIHTFQCGDGHTQKLGPHGEELKELPGFLHYRFTDKLTGEVVETKRATGKWKLPKEMRKRLSESKREYWTEERRAEAKRVMSERAAKMWDDPVIGPKMLAANRSKFATKAARRRMSKAQLEALKDPVKRRNRSEAVRAARLREYEELKEFRAKKAAGVFQPALKPKRRGRAKADPQDTKGFQIGQHVESLIPVDRKHDRKAIVKARELVSEETHLQYKTVAEWHRQFRVLPPTKIPS